MAFRRLASAAHTARISLIAGLNLLVFSVLFAAPSYAAIADREVDLAVPAGPQQLAVVRTLENNRWRVDWDYLARAANIMVQRSAQGQIQRLSGPGGTVLTLSYDANANLISAQGSNGLAVRYIYRGNNLVEVDRDGLAPLRFAYDAAGRLARVDDPRTGTVVIDYDAQGRVTRYGFTDGSSENWSYGQDPQASVAVAHFFFSAQGVAEPVDDKLEPHFEYQGQVLHAIVYPGGVREERDYDAHGWLTATHVGQTVTGSYAYNDVGLIERAKVTGLPELTFSHYPNGKIRTIRDPSGATSQFSYDARGNVVELTNPTGGKSTWTYDQFNRVIAQRDAVGLVTRYEYDEAGRVAKLTEPSGIVRRFAYDRRGRRASETNSGGQTTRYTWDGVGRLTGIDYPDGAFEAFAYDPSGAIIRYIDRQGIVRPITAGDRSGPQPRYSYDKLGRVVGYSDPQGPSSIFELTPDGAIAQTRESDGSVARQTFDAVGNVIAIVHPGAGAITFAYDAVGRVVSKIDALGQQTRHTYDAAGRVLTKTDPAGLVTRYGYDAAGHLSQRAARDRTWTIHYNAIGKAVAIDDSTFPINFSYDQYDRVTRVDYPAIRKSIQYAYDSRGRRSSVTDPDGKRTGYEYDAQGYLSAVVASDGGRFLFNWNNNRQLIKLAYPNGVTGEWTRDAAGRITSILYRTRDGAVVAGATYGYDASGRLISRREAGGNTTAYTYDAADQLIAEANPAGVARYQYEPGGNRSEVDRNGSRLTYRYDAADQMTQAGAERLYHDYEGQVTDRGTSSATRTLYEYDTAGNLTHAVAATGADVTYAYAPTGQRISRQDKSGKTYFVWDRHALLQELGGDLGARASYVHAPGIDHPLAMVRDGKTYYYHPDRLGSIIALSDSGGHRAASYSYDAFGKLTSAPPVLENPFTYTAREWEPALGLYYFRARYYDPVIGRFLSRDQIPGRMERPIELNPYVYANNNPVRYHDPLGLADEWGDWKYGDHEDWVEFYEDLDEELEQLTDEQLLRTYVYESLGTDSQTQLFRRLFGRYPDPGDWVGNTRIARIEEMQERLTQRIGEIGKKLRELNIPFPESSPYEVDLNRTLPPGTRVPPRVTGESPAPPPAAANNAPAAPPPAPPGDASGAPPETPSSETPPAPENPPPEIPPPETPPPDVTPPPNVPPGGPPPTITSPTPPPGGPPGITPPGVTPPPQIGEGGGAPGKVAGPIGPSAPVNEPPPTIDTPPANPPVVDNPPAVTPPATQPPAKPPAQQANNCEVPPTPGSTLSRMSGGAATGALSAAALTFLICKTGGGTTTECLKQSGESAVTGALLGALAATGPLGAVLAAAYGFVPQAGEYAGGASAAEQALLEARNRHWNMPNSFKNGMDGFETEVTQFGAKNTANATALCQSIKKAVDAVHQNRSEAATLIAASQRNPTAASVAACQATLTADQNAAESAADDVPADVKTLMKEIGKLATQREQLATRIDNWANGFGPLVGKEVCNINDPRTHILDELVTRWGGRLANAAKSCLNDLDGWIDAARGDEQQIRWLACPVPPIAKQTPPAPPSPAKPPATSACSLAQFFCTYSDGSTRYAGAYVLPGSGTPASTCTAKACSAGLDKFAMSNNPDGKKIYDMEDIGPNGQCDQTNATNAKYSPVTLTNSRALPLVPLDGVGVLWMGTVTANAPPPPNACGPIPGCPMCGKNGAVASNAGSNNSPANQPANDTALAPEPRLPPDAPHDASATPAAPNPAQLPPNEAHGAVPAAPSPNPPTVAAHQSEGSNPPLVLKPALVHPAQTATNTAEPPPTAKPAPAIAPAFPATLPPTKSPAATTEKPPAFPPTLPPTALKPAPGKSAQYGVVCNTAGADTTCTDTLGNKCTSTKGACAPLPSGPPIPSSPKIANATTGPAPPPLQACDVKALDIPWGGSGSASMTVPDGGSCFIGWHDTGNTILDRTDVHGSPAHGTLKPQDQHVLIYSPKTGFKGQDSFSLTLHERSAIDGRTATATVQVSVTVK